MISRRTVARMELFPRQIVYLWFVRVDLVFGFEGVGLLELGFLLVLFGGNFVAGRWRQLVHLHQSRIENEG